MFTLVDSVGAAALVSKHETATPTVDIEIEHYAPATSDLYAQREIVKDGDRTGLVHVDVEDGDGNDVASAKGRYWTSELPDHLPRPDRFV